MNSADTILSKLKKGEFAPLYFLDGDESYYIDEISDFIENNLLPENQKSFNQVVLYGKDLTLPELMNHARRFPMMHDKQVVIVKEAQEMKEWKSTTSLEILNKYLENIQESTVLVFCYKHKKINKNTAVYKKMAKVGVCFRSEKLRDYQLPKWLATYARTKNVKITEDATALMSEFIGTDLDRMTNEFDKILLNVDKSKVTIGVDHIKEYIGQSKEYDIFELSEAIATRNAFKAFRTINYFAENPKANPIFPIISYLYSYFTKLLLLHSASDRSDAALLKRLEVSPYMLKKYKLSSSHYSLGKIVACIGFLKEADLKSKGVGSPVISQSSILKDFLFRLFQ